MRLKRRGDRMIIDAHTYIGESIYWRRKFTVEDLIERMDKNGIDAAMVVAPPPGPYYDDGNKMVFEAAEKYPDRIYGIYRLNPWFREEELEKAEKAVLNWGFKAFHLDPQNESYSISSSIVKPVIDLAEKLDVPIYIRSSQSQFCPPEGIVFLAYSNPNVKIITGRSTLATMLSAFPPISKHLRNLYFETYPLRGGHNGVDRSLKLFLETIDPSRLLFSSHTPFGHLELELKIIELTGVTEDYRRLMMGENVRRLLKL
ncbi:MAG: hypothetical protein DRJ30_04555 [Candidatus Methanomethylicota archaeon]|nr:MAG: hypothetical protein DRJ30_04555 [Candidatus Verstraetearchaeota archaeon]